MKNSPKGNDERKLRPEPAPAQSAKVHENDELAVVL